MARFARIVVPGLPHHVTQRGNRREPIFFENGDHDVYCDMLAEQTHRHGVEVLSLLPDAQPRPLYPDPLDRRGARPCHGRGASTHHQLRQRAGALERPPVPGTLCLGCDGRGPPDRGGPHHQPQSCPRPPGLPRGRLGLVECACASERRRRRPRARARYSIGSNGLANASPMGRRRSDATTGRCTR